MNGLRLLLIGGCLAALATLAYAQEPQTPVTTGAAPAEFVTRKGTHFYLRDKPYYFAGTNLWYGAYLGAPAPIGDRERLGRELLAVGIAHDDQVGAARPDVEFRDRCGPRQRREPLLEESLTLTLSRRREREESTCVSFRAFS